MKIINNYMNQKILKRNIELDHKFANNDVKLGLQFSKNEWIAKLWQPEAQKVVINIYDANKVKKSEILGNIENGIWKFVIPNSLNPIYYNFEITQKNGALTLALDPYAISMAPYNWKTKNSHPLGAFINVDSAKMGPKPQELKSDLNVGVDAIIYEVHVRDLTSLKTNLISRLGTFNAIIENKDIINHLKELGITHLQLMPINSCYSIDETDLSILKKHQGQKWFTNYNWGYDPHNYFTINGWYSSNPSDPYVRIREFKKLVNDFHQAGIGIILDVVYNHMMTNDILNNIIPDYYYRTGSKIIPVSDPALASERVMTRKLIIDSLSYFVNEFNIDGFRFDLVSFTDLETIEKLTKTLRKIKPNILLHGEAWKWTDIGFENSYIKGVVDNPYQFAYFNDTVRNAIKGHDDNHQFSEGLLGGEITRFDDYVLSVVGNIKNYDFPVKIKATNYESFTNDPANALQYISCHDGFTLWDKVNLVIKNNLSAKFQAYRQALIMLFTLQGRKLLLGGTELLYTKPNDDTGQEAEKAMTNDNLIDIFALNPDRNAYQGNSYKTTDYVNGIRWDSLKIPQVKLEIFDFLKNLISFYKATPFFHLKSAQEIKKAVKFENISPKKGILIFSIVWNDQKVIVAHNFSDSDFQYETAMNLVLSSTLKPLKDILQAHSSTIFN